jgi:hypothetical protein
VTIRYPGGATAQLPHLGGRSASGFGWGYVGDGPADLAYSLLVAVAGERVAEAHWSAITETIVATLPADSAWELPVSIIQGWVEGHQAALAGSAPDGEGDAGADRIRIGTQTGWWELGWDPSLASFQAQHYRGTPVADAAREPSAELGAAPGEVPTVGILEERLGFALPASVREALGADQRSRPGAEVRAYDFVSTSAPGATGDASRAIEPAVDPDLRPGPGSGVQLPDTGPTTYAQAMLAKQPLRVWEAEAGDGTSFGLVRVEIIAAEPYTDPDTRTGRQAITYRVCQDARVVFSGDDITAPADVDPRGDDAVRAVVDLLCHPTDGQRLTESQRASLAANADLLTGLVSPLDPPYPPGTRVTVRADRRTTPTTGVVLEAVDGPDGKVSAYVWRPDAAELPGHPWRVHPDHGLVLPANQVTPTLAPADTGVRDWTPSVPLAYGAIVEITGDGGHPVTATVLRAMRDGPDGRLVYDLQPDAAGVAPLRVAAAELSPLTGTAWASVEQLLAQRARDGVPVEVGEVLATATGTHLTEEDGSPAVPADPAPDAAETARPAPPTVTIARHGDHVSVGDPHHGWMTVPADRLAAAMTRPRQEVAALIGAHAPEVRLTGAEAAITLAALAAHHAPTHLPAPPASLPSGPDAHLVNDL